ncbi:MAG: hypothetical protein V3U58_06535, partial [Thermodesulfobacteriota bacterium]
IMVQGQMWAFRRWALQKNYTLERYIETQTKSILDQITKYSILYINYYTRTLSEQSLNIFLQFIITLST